MVPEPFRDARILIVDDERSMVRLLEELLGHAGYRHLWSTSDSREVLGLCAECQPDLILLDLRMPNLDGVQVLRGLKPRRAEAYLPVLVLTADVSRESKRAALEAGASDFVTKPFEQIDLLLRVRNLIEMRFLHKDLRRQNEDMETQVQARTHQLVDTPLGAADERDDLVAASPVPGKTILVVDDEPAVASLLAEALSRDGYKVDMASNGAVALRMLGARDYDLIMSDSGMPVLSGPELYREVERREPRLTRRFVFVTGDILNPRTRAFLAQTGAPQLEKPFTVESVKRVVRRALLAE